MPSAARAAGGTARRSLPSNLMVPERAATTPDSVLNSVVLPAPFGPTMATSSPSPTAIETSCSASNPP
jgi:hypothetical protein